MALCFGVVLSPFTRLAHYQNIHHPTTPHLGHRKVICEGIEPAFLSATELLEAWNPLTCPIDVFP